MPRYFIEVAYKGTNYAGFQKQDNANTIQAELEKAMVTYFRIPTALTGSSRTDAGVHARQNFFHFDADMLIYDADIKKACYHLNAILPPDIVIHSLFQVNPDAHCRFDALYRIYEYQVYQQKDPFLQDRAYHYPYQLNKDILQVTAKELLNHTDFESFAKRNSQVFTNNCTIITSEWRFEENLLIYRVQANRFLRGMVKGLVGTMLKAATKGHSLDHFRDIIQAKDASRAEFSVPSLGLTLLKVDYPIINSGRKAP